MFLADAMFVSRTIKVLMHQRDRASLTTSLFAFISKSVNTELFINETAEDKKDKVRQQLVKNFENEKLFIDNIANEESDSDDLL